MKHLKMPKAVVLATLGMAMLLSITPLDASGATEAEASTTNGDGVLSLSERQALNAMPVAEVTAADLTDVRPRDLPYLDADLRRRIQTPTTTTRSTEGIADSSPPATDGAEEVSWWRRSGHVHRWRSRNAFGWDLMRFEQHITWSWNHSDVRDVGQWTDGSGHWGYTFCGTSPKYQTWGPGRNRKYVAAVGNFGAIYPYGCSVEAGELGGSHGVNRHGKVWVSWSTPQ